MVTPMLRSNVLGGLATHAGDALFEACYLPEFRESARALRDHYEGSYEKFWEDFRSRPALLRQTDKVLVNTWCMAACYSADEDGTVRLPFDTATSELIPEIWDQLTRRGVEREANGSVLVGRVAGGHAPGVDEHLVGLPQ